MPLHQANHEKFNEYEKTVEKSLAPSKHYINETAPLGSRENPYKASIRLKGRSFVMDETGEWREMDKDGNLIPDEEVKPLYISFVFFGTFS